MSFTRLTKALPRLILIAFIVSLIKISEASPTSGDKNIVNQSVNGKASDRRTRMANGDYDSYESHIDYFNPSPVDISTDDSEAPYPATADCPPICGNDHDDTDDSYVPFQSSAEDDSASDHSDEDPSVEYEPENHDFEGNVQWTSK